MRVERMIAILQNIAEQLPGAVLGARVGQTEDFSPHFHLLVVKQGAQCLVEIHGIIKEDGEKIAVDLLTKGVNVVFDNGTDKPNFGFPKP